MTAQSRPVGRVAGTRRRKMPLVVILGALLLAGLGVLLALNTASAAQELRQRSLIESNTAATDTEQELLREVGAKQAPANLAAAAAALGLIPNPNPAFLQIDADGSVHVLGSPAAAVVVPTATPTPATPSKTATPSATPSKAATPSKSAVRPAATGTATKPTATAVKSTVAKPTVAKSTATKSGAATSTTPKPTATAQPTRTAGTP